ncbi:MAG TPA: DUF2071 domain-containing protein [Pirellulaceae bacterium]|nr:DUF2071 domain-containing protein [Pirellulaceae bacterium]
MTWLQHWTDVLFLHFPVASNELAPPLPRRLEIDTFDSQAWLSYVFFRLRLRPSGLPFVPRLSSLIELNVRTYVRHRGQSGIFFLRMYANNRWAIRAARLLTPLCYEPATMSDTRFASGSRHIECRPAKSEAGVLAVDFSAQRAPAEALPGSLDAWLLERYRLFVGNRDGSLSAADVDHPPWRASPVKLTALDHSFSNSLGYHLAAQPEAMHYSPGVAARFNAFHVVAAADTKAMKVHRPDHVVVHHGDQ